MSLKPLGDRVIVKADEAETTTASGLYLASDAKEKPQTGVVVSVGEGKYGGTEVHYKGQDVLILRADDIYAICED